MKPRHHALLNRDSTVLVVVDLQEPFLRHIHRREEMLNRCRFLIRAAEIVGIPVVCTTQYAQRMGGVVAEIAELLPSADERSVDKLTFSAASTQEFCDRLLSFDREQILLCGVETHICVLQTALDLIHVDYQVHCAADAVCSRTLEMHKLGMEKIRDCGVYPCSAEGAVMEILQQAGTPEFKSALELIK